MDQNVSEWTPISADPVPILDNSFSQHWWVVDDIKLARATLASLVSSMTHKC